MRPRPLLWFTISALCFAGAFYFWHLGERWAAERAKAPGKDHPPPTTDPGPGKGDHGLQTTDHRPRAQETKGGALQSAAASGVVTNYVFNRTNQFAFRLTNTTATISQLQRRDSAILLENALLDTTRGAPSIPAHLLAQGDPGTWIVQARGPINDAFRALLGSAGASIISYIPNNAYLIRASKAVADQLQASALAQAVLPYEPYYKLKSSLLSFAVAQQPLPENSALKVLLFSDAADQTRSDLQKLGAQIVGDPERTPFGPVVTLRSAEIPPGQSSAVEPGALLPAIASLPGVQEVEWTLARMPANDLSRVRVGVSLDTLVANNYLLLTGSNVMVNVNDSGIDAKHPDLTRVFSPTTNGLSDLNGHGTHVAGIIASSGVNAFNGTNDIGSILYSNNFGSLPSASFRGKAPLASLFSLPIDMLVGPFEQGTYSWPSDSYLQETPAKTNVFISNNSWNYVGPDAQSYDLHAASYDAAVRDALPFVTGSQPLLFVFSAGNGGGGDPNGTGGAAGTIESPGTAKNVITVGAIEQLRNITNIVTTVDAAGVTNMSQPWVAITDSSNQVASFSSRGNVGVNIEGQYGRFKPDVVAPGVFVVSTASANWDTNLPGIYYNPTNDIVGLFPNIIVPTNNFDQLYYDSVFVTDGALQLTISVFPNTNSPVPFPKLPIYVSSSNYPTNEPGGYDFVGINSVTVTNPRPSGQYWFFGVGNTNALPVNCDLRTDVLETNTLWNYLLTLQGMNNLIGPHYRFESGTSMAAADVSGVLALMQEFFEQRLGQTNSPALMKALLINGARSVASIYDFNVKSPLNLEGWGLINLPTSIPAALTDVNATTNTMFMLDQSPANALATRDSRTFKVSLTTDAQNQPLRVTLVWTDPPGNPVASIKLVNDLDLIVTNLDNTNLVYYGNDIRPGNTFNQAWNTNTAPDLELATDKINNVENVFLDPRLGENGVLATNYSITVVAHRVNVNAVTAHTDNVVQDYALVVSCGDGLLTNALSLNTNAPIVSVTLPFVTNIANTFGPVSPDFEGGVLLSERTGASTPLLGTNSILPIINDGALPTNAVLTIGMTNQWSFYVISNTLGFTNAAFLTFLPPELAVPRLGVFVTPEQNPNRPEADIDLYVAPPTIPNNYNLTNLDPAVIEASIKSLSRGGTETIVLSNAVPGVYYIGVKAEDQMAAQYTLMALFSRRPIGSTDDQGNQSLIGIPYPAPIPDGSPDNPGVVQIFAISPQDIMVRRVIVTNTIQHELMSDLVGYLSHSGINAVLNNNTCVKDLAGNCQTCTTYIYDDSDEGNVGPGVTICPASVQRTDGPGHLDSFGGQGSVGQWMLTMVDNATNHVGTNVFMELFLEKQPDLAAGNGVTFTLPAGACRRDFVAVPVNATSLSVTAAVVTATPPFAFSVTVCPSDGGACKTVVVTNGLGGGVTIDLTDTPPLEPGTTYSVRTCNIGPAPITLNLRAFFGYSLNTIIPVSSTSTKTPVDIIDNACTNVYLTNNINAIISSLDVGLLINSPRISDLAITLVSPNGTRSLLFEDRGNTSSNGLGTFNLVTNFVPAALYTNNFDLAPVGLYATGAVFQGWSVLSNTVDVLDDFTCFCLSNHILALLDGAVSNSLPTTIALPVTDSYAYNLSFKVNHLPWLDGMVTWWPLDVDGSDIFGGMNGLLLGDVAFPAGQGIPFREDFTGPLNANWQAYLPTTGTGGSLSTIETYVGAPGYFFTNVGTSTVVEMTNQLSAQQRVGWRSALPYTAQSFRYEVRFNTLSQGPRVSVGAPIEIWLMDALNPNRYDVISLFGGNTGDTRTVLAGNTIDTTNNILPYAYQNNTWYRLAITGGVGKKVRASLLDDNGAELVGQDFAHGPSAFSQGFRLGLSQFMGTNAGVSPVYVAVDSATLTTALTGEVNQAYFGDGEATRMVVPGCAELDLGHGRGFSIEGWVWPGNAATWAPLLEWYNSAPATNQASLGIQFWLALTNSPGLLGATIWDTNMVSHIITTTTNALTNGGWQHVALTYDTNSGIAALYVNGLTTTGLPLVSTNLGFFVPQTSGDVYLGFDPTAVPIPINYPTFASISGLNLVGAAAQVGTALRVSPAIANQLGDAWAQKKQSCAGGFNTSFQFRITNPGGPGGLTPGGDGFSFALQNIGPSTLDLGVGSATNNFRVFFNTSLNAGEVSGNSVGVLTNNSYLTQTDLTPLGFNPKDGKAHVGKISFDGAFLSVWLDNVMVVTNVPIPDGLGAAVDPNGYAWVGFNASSSAVFENHDILSWTFGRAGTGTSLQGGLDEFSLYNRALTPCEVSAIYHAGSNGKYGTNALLCPVVTEVTLSNALSGIQRYTFTNGVSWVTNGPQWETNTISFSTSTNPTAIVVRGLDPYSTNNPYSGNNLNAVVDDFVLSGVVPQYFNGLLHFTEDTNLATIPIKFAPTPYEATNFSPILVFTNTFSYATAQVYQVGATIQGAPNGVVIGSRNWTVTAGQVTVVSNAFFESVTTNWLAMSTGAVQCVLPTLSGHRYELSYSLRGPCASGWWNGAVDPLSQRARDLISGNNGAFFYGATNTAAAFLGDSSRAFVGPAAFFFSGQTEPGPELDPDLWPEDIDDPASHIELGDPPQLRFTNGFTIEAWIRPLIPTNQTFCGTEQIFFRGYPEPLDCHGLGDPYWLALEPTSDPASYDIHFHIAGAHYGTTGADALTTNAPVLVGGGTNDGWWHVAAVFDKPFTNINVVTNGTTITFTTNQMRLYLNGVCVASNFTTLSPYENLDPSLNPGASIGGRSRYDWTEPFSGFMDELTVYARALTAPEISAIASAGTRGQADLAVPAALSLAKLSVAVDGINHAVSYGDNSRWSTYTIQFTALQDNSVVTLQSLLPGTLLDGITITEVPSELHYLPETSLTELFGKNGAGVWTLELCDTRVGPGPATSDSKLLDWQLSFTLAPSNPPPVITLQHGITYTNSLAAHSGQYFIVPMPQWATYATNVLLFAEQVHTTAPLSATVFFNPTNFPTLTDIALLDGVPSRTLSTNTTPAVTTGQSYYLLVTNPNPVGLTFGLQVAFDIITLNNCELLVSNLVSQAGIPRYLQFDVPGNLAGSGFPPQAVSFWISNSTCNLKVVLSEHLPLPDLDHYDYTSQQPCTNDQVVMLVTNSTPFPIETNRWYVGVFNTTTTNVLFNAQACMSAPYPLIVPLSDGIPFTASATNKIYSAPPGPPQWLFFDFLVQSPSSGVLFELYNLTGNADLVLQQDVPPTMFPYFATSFFTRTNPEQIVLRSDTVRPSSVYVPDLRGHWYLGVYNNEQTNIGYTIRATLPDSDRLLSSALPIRTSLAPMPSPHGLLLSWNSVIGERYFIQYTPSIASPIIWTNLGSILASTPLTTFEVLPVPPNGGFFRVLQFFEFQPLLHIQQVSTNVVRLYWSTIYQNYRLQYRNGFVGPWLNLTTTPGSPYPPYPPAVQEGLNWAAYDRVDPLLPKYYRLVTP